MDALLNNVAPMLVAFGVIRIGGEAIAASVRNRLIRAILLLAAFAIWTVWQCNYMIATLAR
jgi:hypothetical protein